MSDTSTGGLKILGADTFDDTVVCEGDSCLIPAHPEQRLINRRVDDNQV